MGMDVYGKKPSAPEGEYFRRNVWGWRPLADMVTTLFPELTDKCRYWQSNDGDGLDAQGARRLAEAIDKALANGDVESWVKIRAAEVSALPNETCELCGGTGIRCDATGKEMKQPERVIGEAWGHKPDHPRYGQTGWCNGCDGRGWNKSWARSYSVDIDDAKEFAAFLRASGGFEIC